ncbi:MAG: hypothetical protein ACFFCY_05515 [Promethearchaeota archaeon]
MFEKINRQNRLIIIIFIFIILSLISNNFIPFSRAQANGDHFTVYSKFELLEFGETNAEMQNISSIDFSLPSENWNLTDIELNFTNIQSKREIKDIETQGFGTKDLYKGRKGLAVQIIITKPTNIYGVHIYGYEASSFTTTTVIIQINGYDSGLNRPNSTIYGSTEINITSELKWHIQNFSAPIYLNPGNYYLVMNGIAMLPQEGGKYYWYFNNNPEVTNLYTSEWDGSWVSGITGEPLHYKLDQKILGKFSPEEINMTADIDGTHYPISDGPVLGSGYLNESVYVIPSDHNITIPINHNSSINLIFNLSYTFKFESQLNSFGSGLVNEESPNAWILPVIIERFFDYQLIQFIYPNNWYNFSILQKSGVFWENKTSEIQFDENSLIITNNTIKNGNEWKITANSPNIDFNINLDALDWAPGQLLQFFVIAPLNEGNLTFYNINPLGIGYDQPIEIKEHVAGEIRFDYIIPTNSRDGTYTIIIYWNNMTDGGVQIQEFEVNVPLPPFTIDPIWIVIGVIISITGTTAGVLSYRYIKKYRIRKIEEAEKLYNKCMDVLNLDYIIVSEKRSGINVYQQQFAKKEIDAAMISGFLQAIHSFGIELIKIEDSSQTIKLEYKDSIIIMTEFVNLRLILIMKEAPSSNFLYSLEDLAYDLYKYYGPLVDTFTGDIKPFKSIEKLLKHHLSTSLTYPMKLAKIELLEKIRISPSERVLINKAISYMKTKNTDSFYMSSLLPEKECSPKDLESILDLIEKKIFQVIE